MCSPALLLCTGYHSRFSNQSTGQSVLSREEVGPNAAPTRYMLHAQAGWNTAAGLLSTGPLLQVDYTGFSTINAQRFGQKFVGKVANPHDILLWHKAPVRKAKVGLPLACHSTVTSLLVPAGRPACLLSKQVTQIKVLHTGYLARHGVRSFPNR